MCPNLGAPMSHFQCCDADLGLLCWGAPSSFPSLSQAALSASTISVPWHSPPSPPQASPVGFQHEGSQVGGKTGLQQIQWRKRKKRLQTHGNCLVIIKWVRLITLITLILTAVHRGAPGKVRPRQPLLKNTVNLDYVPVRLWRKEAALYLVNIITIHSSSFFVF